MKNISPKGLMLLFAITMAYQVNADMTAKTPAATHENTAKSTQETIKSLKRTIKNIFAAPGNYFFGNKRTAAKTAFEAILYSAAVYGIYKLTNPLFVATAQLATPIIASNDLTKKPTETATTETPTPENIKIENNTPLSIKEPHLANTQQKSQKTVEQTVQQAKEFGEETITISGKDITISIAPEPYLTELHDIPTGDEETPEEIGSGLKEACLKLTEWLKPTKTPRKTGKMTDKSHKKEMKKYRAKLAKEQAINA